MKKLWGLLLLGLLALPLWGEIEKLSVWDAWRSAYELTEQGERLIISGKYPEAEAKYIAARRIYQKIQTARPEWSAGTITARLKLCDSKITDLQTKLSSESAPSRVKVATASEPTNYQAMYLEQKRHLETAQKQLQNFATLQKNTEQLLREKQQHSERIALLEKQLQSKSTASTTSVNPLLQQKIDELTTSLNHSESTRLQLSKELGDLKATLSTRDTAQGELRKSVDTQLRQINLLQNANQLRASELEKSASDLRTAITRLNRSEKTAEGRQGEIRKLNDLIDNMRKTTGSTDANTELILQNRQSRTELDKLKLAISELEAALSDFKLTNDKQKQNLLILRNDYNIVALERQRLADDSAQFRLDYRKLSDDFKNSVRERENLQGEIKSLRDTLKSWMDKYDALLLSYNNKSGTEVLALRNLDQTNAALSKTADARQEQLDLLSTTLAKERLLTQELTAQKNQLKQEIFSVQSRNLLLENDRLTLDDLNKTNEELNNELAALRKKLSDRDVYIAVDHQNFAASTKPDDEKALKVFLTDAVDKAEAANDFAMSAWYYEELLKLSPDNPELAIKSICYHLLNQNQSAVQELLSLFPARNEIIFLHGLTELVKKRYPSAQNDFLKLTVADGNSFICRELILRTLDKVYTALPSSAQNQLTISQARRILR